MFAKTGIIMNPFSVVTVVIKVLSLCPSVNENYRM